MRLIALAIATVSLFAGAAEANTQRIDQEVKTQRGNRVYTALEKRGVNGGNRYFQAQVTFKDHTRFNSPLNRHWGVMNAVVIAHTVDGNGQIGKQVYTGVELQRKADGTFHGWQDVSVNGANGRVTAIEVAPRTIGRVERYQGGSGIRDLPGYEWDHAEDGNNIKMEGFHQ